MVLFFLVIKNDSIANINVFSISSKRNAKKITSPPALPCTFASGQNVEGASPMGCFLATTLNYAICNPSFAIKREMKLRFVR
jgi:hypothetical protein